MRNKLILTLLFCLFTLSSNAKTFNVKKFGAVGDGVAIDSPAINAAIEAAAQKKGSKVLIPAGTYKLDIDNTMNPWTIGYDYSGGYKVNAEGTGYDWNEAFKDATVEVKADGLRMECEIAGATFVVVYNGVPRVYAY